MARVTFHISAEIMDNTPAILIDHLSEDLAVHVREAIFVTKVAENWKASSDEYTEELTVETTLKEGRY